MASIFINNLKLEALLFDLDGVIINSNGPIIHFWKSAAQEYGIELTETTLIQHIYGVPARDTLNRIFNKLSIAEKEGLLARLTTFEANLDYKEIPGAVEFVNSLKKIGIATALVTSSERPKVDIALNKIGLTDAFTTLITTEYITKGKPDPECYRTAAERLGKKPEHCLVFEDALSGVKAALSAGANCIGVQQAKIAQMLRSAGAFATIADFSEIAIGTENDQLRLII